MGFTRLVDGFARFLYGFTKILDGLTRLLMVSRKMLDDLARVFHGFERPPCGFMENGDCFARSS